jgi:hypothetical protein
MNNKTINISQLSTTEIKAYLFDLQYHNCNGSFDSSSLPFEGNNRPCDGCAMVMQLRVELNKRNNQINV